MTKNAYKNFRSIYILLITWIKAIMILNITEVWFLGFAEHSRWVRGSPRLLGAYRQWGRWFSEWHIVYWEVGMWTAICNLSQINWIITSQVAGIVRKEILKWPKKLGKIYSRRWFLKWTLKDGSDSEGTEES